MNTDSSKIFSNYRQEVYNGLDDIFEAEERFNQATEANSVIEYLGDLIRSSGLSELVGLWLMHKHNDVRGDGRMEESLRSDDNHPSLHMELVESPVSDAVPVSWKVMGTTDDVHLVPIEFSRQAFAASMTRETANRLGALGSIARAIKATGTSELLGIATLRYCEIEDPACRLVEHTEPSRPANIIRNLRPAEVAPGSTIQTHWRFRTFEPSLGCGVGCQFDVACDREGWTGHRRRPMHYPRHQYVPD